MLDIARISLLLIETEQAALEVCRDMIALHFPKLIVHAASDPDAALTLFKDQKHDIVVSDVCLPSEDGIRIAREMCSEKPDTLVLFITADPSLNRHIIEPFATELCLKRIIDKPLNIEELLSSISKAVEIIENRDNHRTFITDVNCQYREDGREASRFSQ